MHVPSRNLPLAEVTCHAAGAAIHAYVGIDWADTKHDICLQAAGDARRESRCIRHQVAAIDEWANTLYLASAVRLRWP